MKLRESDMRQVGCTVEGFGEYATRWPEYEHRCPDCGCWSKGSDVTQTNGDGTEGILCPKCAAEVIADWPQN